MEGGPALGQGSRFTCSRGAITSASFHPVRPVARALPACQTYRSSCLVPCVGLSDVWKALTFEN